MLTRYSLNWAPCPLRPSVVRLRGSSVLHGPGRPLCSHPGSCSLAVRLGRSASQHRLTTALFRAGNASADDSQFTLSSWRNNGAASAVSAAYDTWGTVSDEQDDPLFEHPAQQVQHPGSQPSNGHKASIPGLQQGQQQQHLQQVPGGPTLPHQAQQQQRLPIPAAADVQFSIQQKVEYEQIIRVVGSDPALGSWNPSMGPDMTWNRHDIWTMSASLPVGRHEFKYLLVHRSGHLEWESGSNRDFEVLSSPCQMQVQGHWGATGGTDVLILQQQQQKQQQPAAEASQQSGRKQPPDQQQQQQVKQPAVDADTASDQQQQQRGPGPAGSELSLSHLADLAGQVSKDNNRTHHLQHAAAVLDQQPLSAVLSQAAAASIAPSPAAITGLSASQQQLVNELAVQRQHLATNIAEIATGVKEINTDLDLLHDDLAHITAERVLQEMQRQKGRSSQQQQRTTPARSDNGSDQGSTGDSGWSDVVSQAVAKANSVYQQASPYRIKHIIKASEGQPRLPPQEQAPLSLLEFLAERSGSISSSGLGPLPGSSSSNEIKLTSPSGTLDHRSSNGSQNSGTGEHLPTSTMASSNGSRMSHSSKQDTGNSSSSSSLVNMLHAAAQKGVPAPVSSAGQGGPRTASLSSKTTGGALSSVDPTAGLQCAVLSWRQELLSFRHDALLMQEELTAVEDSISSAQQQMQVNRAAWTAQGGTKRQGSTSRDTTPDVSPAVVTGASTASAASDGAQLDEALVNCGSSEQLSARYPPAVKASQATAGWASRADANAAAASESATARNSSPSNSWHSNTPVSAASNGSMRGPPVVATKSSWAPSVKSTESFTASTPQLPPSGGSIDDSSGSEAPVADNVSDYQRLLRRRLHELADLIATDLTISAESLTEEAQHQRQQQKQKQVKAEQQAGKAKFAAAHHAASAAYASGRTPADDASGEGL